MSETKMTSYRFSEADLARADALAVAMAARLGISRLSRSDVFRAGLLALEKEYLSQEEEPDAGQKKKGSASGKRRKARRRAKEERLGVGQKKKGPTPG
jgi:hypothetical protein